MNLKRSWVWYNFSVQQIDWKDLSKNYKGLWVALDEKEKNVVSSGKNAKTVYNKAIKQGIKIPTFFKVPSKQVLFVG